jgi:hypothetical protein
MMQFFSMVAMNAAIPEMAIDMSIGSMLMALVAVVFAIGAVVVFNVYCEQMEATSRRRTVTHLKMVQRPAFGAAQ